MTVTDAEPAQDWSAPAHDNLAEACSLGAMMMSPAMTDAIGEILTAEDFYKPVHGTIFNAIMRLAATGQPIDGATVTAELASSGEIVRVGGVPYLHSLIEAVPTAANGPHYALKVADAARRRRIVEAGLKVVQLGRQDSDVAEIAEQAQETIHTATTDKRDRAVITSIGDLADPALQHIEDVADGKIPPGIPTGLKDYDYLTGGHRPGQLIIPAGRTSMGKALALDTPIPTPGGWSTMGDLRPGDAVFGIDGNPCRVTAVTPAMVDRPCFEVAFSDGEVITADAEHEWWTRTRSDRRQGGAGAIRTTTEIARTIEHRPGLTRWINHTIDRAGALQAPDADLPIDPYVLGVWLGDGTSRSGQFTSADDEIVLAVDSAGYFVRKLASPYQYGTTGLFRQLRMSGLLQNKHIPSAYLRASEAQRRALLAGLLDTDGSITNYGSGARFEVCSRRLAADAHELIISLGYRCAMTTRRVPGRTEESSTSYRLTFSTADKVFRLTRKAARQNLTSATRTDHRSIVAARPVSSVPVRCIEVDGPGHLYLAGRSMIPTHNSVITQNWVRHCAQHVVRPVVLFSNEMSELDMMMRFYSEVARVPIHQILHGKITEDDRVKLRDARDLVMTWPLYVVDTCRTIPSIRAYLRRFTQRHGDLAMFAVDYLQKITPVRLGRREEQRYAEIGQFANDLKDTAMDLKAVCIAPCQLNRGPADRGGKEANKPRLTDLRESGDLEQTADNVILIHRPDYYDKQSSRPGEADLIVAKQRHGPTDTITVTAQLHIMRFVDMATIQPNSWD